MKLIQMISLHIPLVILILSLSILIIFVVLILTAIILCRTRNRNINKKTSNNVNHNGNTLTSIDHADREIASINGKIEKEWDTRSPKSIGSWFARSEVGDKSIKCSQTCSEVVDSPKSAIKNESIYEETMNCIQARKLPMPPSAMEWSGFYNGSHKYIKPRKNSKNNPSETPSATSCTMPSNHTPSPHPLKKFYPTILYHDRFHSTHYFDPVIYKDYLVKRSSFRTLSIDGNLSKHFFPENISPKTREKMSLPRCSCTSPFENSSKEIWKQLPREKLVYLREIGEGPFGKICLCEMMPSVLTSVFNKREKVIVKLLKEENYDEIKSYFLEEIRLMSRLKHKNIATLVGVCVDEFPYCIVTEYSTNGDLKKFLQHFDIIHPNICNPDKKIISFNILAFFCYQISNGMEYLESLNLVHRDIATRNCLVGDKGLIKISDFGMSRCLHSSDYYQIQGIAVLPIRWMAWESVFLGKFSTASDVWSFGITLWEIMTLAKQQPFNELTDEQIIENCQKYFHKNLSCSNMHDLENCSASNDPCSHAYTDDDDSRINVNDDGKINYYASQEDYDDINDANKLFENFPPETLKLYDIQFPPKMIETDDEASIECTESQDCQPLLLSKPYRCPNKFYHLMLFCWDVNPKTRPGFLQLKNTLRCTFDVDAVNQDVNILDEFTASRSRNECFSLDNRKRINLSNSTLSSPAFEHN